MGLTGSCRCGAVGLVCTACSNEGLVCYGDVVFSDLLPETGYNPVYYKWLWYSKLKRDGQVRNGRPGGCVCLHVCVCT